MMAPSESSPLLGRLDRDEAEQSSCAHTPTGSQPDANDLPLASENVDKFSDASHDDQDDRYADGGDTERADGESNEQDARPAFSTAVVIPILLLGVFIANADGSLVLATNEIIASEFHALGDAGWIVTSYGLAMCAVQPLYGKLADIYGRRSILVSSYLFFAIGCAITGVGSTLWQVVVGRVISGAGGAGMNSLVSIIIADMVPIREIASWRGYVNIAATTGRSLGGPVGGWLADTVGWRWSFYGQFPPSVLAALLVLWKLRMPSTKANGQTEETESHSTKIKRIDFLGAALLASATVCFMMLADIGGQKVPWTAPIIFILAGLSVALGILFLLVEAYVAKESVFPIRLMLHRDVYTSYAIAGLQMGAQMGMMYSIPLYFQVTSYTSIAAAGAHLIPAVAGNALAMLLVGAFIKRTGRYKLPTILGSLSAATCYTLLILRWHGHTNIWESLYIIPGGFGTGLCMSTTFVHLTAGIDASDLAIAGTGLYQAQNLGSVLGLSVTAAVLQSTLRSSLERRLQGRPKIIQRAIEDIEFVQSLKGPLRHVVVRAYVRSLMYTHVASLTATCIGLLASMSMDEHKL